MASIPGPTSLFLALPTAVAALGACGADRTTDQRTDERSLTVTATAYTSTPGQTDARPGVAAWGDTLRPGMRAIAISPDLLGLGLEPRTPVRIDGIGGPYLVLDRMDDRWRRRIDIYMGDDLREARRWGERRVTIRWNPTHGSGAQEAGGGWSGGGAARETGGAAGSSEGPP